MRAGKLIVFSDGAPERPSLAPPCRTELTLSFAGNVNYATAESLTLNGTGATGSAGALGNISGNNSFAGPIRLGSASTIGSQSGTLALSGTISNAGFASTFTGAGDVNVTGGMSGTGGTGGVTKTGAGTVILSGHNTFTGILAINNGTLLLGASDRIANGVNVTLGGGRLASGGYDEIVATLTHTADSIIDFGNANSIIHFSASTGVGWTPNTVL